MGSDVQHKKEGNWTVTTVSSEQCRTRKMRLQHLLFLFSCPFLLSDPRQSHLREAHIVNHGNQWWKIKTTGDRVEIGEDYQYNYSDESHDESYSDTSDAGSREALNEGDAPGCSSDRHGSVGFAIDTTSSMAQALPMVKKMVSSLVKSGSKIPRWVLTDFKDPDVKLVRITTDVEDLKSGLDDLKYGGGGDIWEQVLKGIQVTLENMPDHGVILAVTDAGTKMKELEESIQKKISEKNVKIFFAFSPFCQAKCSDSIPIYNRLSQGRMFNQTEFDQEAFFKSVVHTVQHPCSDPAPASPTTVVTTTVAPTTVVTTTKRTHKVRCRYNRRTEDIYVRMCSEGLKNYTESDCKCAGLPKLASNDPPAPEPENDGWEEVAEWIERLYNSDFSSCRNGFKICRYNAETMPTCVKRSRRNNVKCYCTILTDYLLRNCWITRKPGTWKEYGAGDWVNEFVTGDLQNANALKKNEDALFIDTDAL